jgi:hypothetical protein
MKCPLLIQGYMAGQPDNEIKDAECRQEECAWWLGDIQMCAMRDLALETRYVQHRLAELATIINERR